MKYLLKDIVKLPEKKDIKDTPFDEDNIENLAINQAIDEIGNIQVEIDVEKLADTMIAKVDALTETPKSSDEMAFKILSGITPRGFRYLAQAIASNFKEVIK